MNEKKEFFRRREYFIQSPGEARIQRELIRWSRAAAPYLLIPYIAASPLLFSALRERNDLASLLY
jgi:hypothetical protein